MDVAKASSRLASFSSDEETEDDGEPTMAQDGAPTAGNGAAATDSAGQPLIEELLIEKKRAAKRKFTEDMLIGPCGLDRMYETFPNKCRMRGRGYEV